MSKNYFITILLLVIVGLPFLNSIPAVPAKARGVVFYNFYEKTYFISSFKENKTIWIKPVNKDVLLYRFEGQNIIFQYKNLSTVSQLNVASATFINAPAILTAEVTNIDYQQYPKHRFIVVWVQVFISFFAFIIALLIWRRHITANLKTIGDKIDGLNLPIKEDWGIFFFGAALILWAMTAVISLYSKASGVAQACVSMLSISNDFLFALSFPFFKHNIPFFKENRSRYLLVFSIIYILALLISGYSYSVGAVDWGEMAELYFSVLTFTALGFLLNESFTQRKSPGTGLISLLCIGLAIYAQMFQVMPGLASRVGEWADVLYLGSFSMVVLLYVTLVYSWYTEEVEIRLLHEKEIDEWTQKLEEADRNDTKTVLNCFRELRANSRIRKPMRILREKYADHPEFIDKLIHMESRLSDLKKSKNSRTEDAKTLETAFNRLNEDLNDVVVHFLTQFGQNLKTQKD